MEVVDREGGAPLIVGMTQSRPSDGLKIGTWVIGTLEGNECYNEVVWICIFLAKQIV